MIKIENLTKIYKIKKRKKHKALDNITVTLPDNGLVFVLGKSGSGKSTLLNLIGGLDSITEGNIVVDENDISKFKEKDYCDYRNNHVGFIFQDYHLIDELTIYENIALSLNLRKIKDKNTVSQALKKVDLEGYEDRYPAELSGGERQRIAIARAIVKKPRIILADEPTGNLDSNTSNKVITLLKSLSKDCLILIVSHNVNDAYTYADRILELSKGKIINDVTKNPGYTESVVLKNDTLYYPSDKLLDDNDIDTINKNLNKINKFAKLNDKYIPTREEAFESHKVKIEKTRLSFFDSLILSFKFLKNKIINIFSAAFMVSVIMVILALSLTFINFDSASVIAQEMHNTNQKTLLMQKIVNEDLERQLNGDYRVRIDENDIQAFYDAGYKGEIYEVLNLNVPIVYCQNTNGFSAPFLSETPFVKETLGTIIVNDEFLKDKFGEIDYVAKLNTPYPEGLTITDYVADSILNSVPTYAGKTYEEVLGEFVPCGWSFGSVKINAIIKTDYKEKHSELFNKIEDNYFENASQLYDDADFMEFINDVYYRLGYSYTLNQSFLDYAHLTRIFNSHSKLTINDCLKIEDSAPYITFLPSDAYKDLNGKSILMAFSKYNELFDASYDATNYKTFTPQTIKVSSYHFYDIDNENPLYTYELTIDGLHAAGDTFIINEDVYPDLRKEMFSASIYSYALYFDGVEGIGDTLDIAEETNYEPQSLTIETVHTMTKTIEVFTSVFVIIAVALSCGVIFILVSFSSKMIRSKMHEIGILKALGTQNQSIGMVFGIQIILIAILTMIMSIVSYYYCVNLANELLIISLKKFASAHIVLDLVFLEFKFNVACFSVGLIALLSVISFVSPMIKIKNIKPVQIIKAKE